MGKRKKSSLDKPLPDGERDGEVNLWGLVKRGDGEDRAVDKAHHHPPDQVRDVPAGLDILALAPERRRRSSALGLRPLRKVYHKNPDGSLTCVRVERMDRGKILWRPPQCSSTK